MTGRLDFTVKEGLRFDRLLRWTNEAHEPYDLTGWTGRMHWRLHWGGPLLLAFTTGSGGGLLLGDAAGTIRMQKSAEDMSDLTWDDGVWDLKLFNQVGAPSRPVGGELHVDKQVTI